MNVKNDISEELRSLSALVATISRETPYRAPEGYFLSFPEAVLERVQPNLIKTAREVIKTAREVPRIAGLENDKPLTFSVPEGYFEGFAQQMLNRIKAGSGPSTGTGEGEALSAGLDTLPEILVQAGRRTPYMVPEGYFDGLSPVLAVLKDKNPYLVPTGYFDWLAAGIVAEVNGSRKAEPAVDRAPYEQPLAAMEQGSRARVIGFGKRMNWMKYAAAAVVAGLIVTVGWLRWHSTTPSAQVAGTQQQTPVDIAKTLSRVSDQELQNFLVEQDTTLAQPLTNNASMAALGMDDSDIKSLLGDVSDGDLKQYMEEHGVANDIATN